MPVVIRTRTMTARRKHECMWCRATAVEPGQEYVRTTLVEDDHMYDWVACQPCIEAVKFVVDWADGYADEGISEDLILDWARDIGPEADSTPETQTGEQQSALAFLARYGAGMVIDHVFIGVAGHADDNECTHRADGTDATYCGRREDEHVWGAA
ncbi:hypothetical protein [Microbacterium sp. LB12]|uniref:hypothetical protein n=2 Tax=unclassified Microbacterium TaxID=2609290 RepID=UPI00301ABA4B